MIRQIIRGCGTLPHLGEHPGTGLVFMFIVMGALVGSSKGGWRGAIVGAFAMALCMLPFYLIGAYDRAEESDRIEGNQ